MLLNHDTAKRGIESVRNTVRRIAPDAIKYNEKVGYLVKCEDLSEQGKATRRAEYAEEFKTLCKGYDEDFQKALDEIKEAELKNNELFDITDNELQTAIQLIKAVDGQIEQETRNNIVNKFKGNKQALIMLKSVYEAYEIDTKYLVKHIVDIESFIEERKALAHSLVADVNTTTHKMQKICNDLYYLAELLGIPFTEEEKDTGLNLDEYYDKLARSAMGL